MTFNSIILWCALIMGMLAALAAFYGRYRTLPEIFSKPLVCDTTNGGCNSLFQTKTAKLLGVPNALLGVILYLFLAIGLIAGFPIWLLFLAASCGLIMSIYLAFNLIKNRRECRICWIGHLSNAIIWAALLGNL